MTISKNIVNDFYAIRYDQSGFRGQAIIILFFLYSLFRGGPLVLSSIEYFSKQRKQEGATGEAKDDKCRDVGRKMP